MSLAHPQKAGLSRGALKGCERRVLSRGGGFKADVSLVMGPEGAIVVKDFAARRSALGRLVGRWLCAREARAYRRLSDITVVPDWRGTIDRFAFAVAYRPGVMLTRSLRGKLPASFMAELEAGLAEIHQRGFVHLDLRHRSNILAGEDGRPVVVDFASALYFDPGRRLGRLAHRIARRFDERALDKWRVRIEP